GCVETPAAAGTSCETDNNLCNGKSTCSGNGVCMPGTPLACNSHSACVVDSCMPATGCVATPIPSCDPRPVQGENPFERRASVLGRVVGAHGGPLSGATFTVYDNLPT